MWTEACGDCGTVPFVKTGRSRCLAICEAPARARVEGGVSLPRLSCYTTPYHTTPHHTTPHHTPHHTTTPHHTAPHHTARSDPYPRCRTPYDRYAAVWCFADVSGISISSIECGVGVGCNTITFANMLSKSYFSRSNPNLREHGLSSTGSTQAASLSPQMDQGPPPPPQQTQRQPRHPPLRTVARGQR